MSENKKAGPVEVQKGYKPAVVGDGYKPLRGPAPSGVSRPGAGHQPTPSGPRPALPTTGTGVKPAPKKD